MKRLAILLGAWAAFVSLEAGPAYAGDSYALSGAEAAGFSLPGDVTLVKTIALPASGLVRERYQQRVGGAAVLGGQITLLKNAQGTIVAVIGAHHSGLVARNAARLSHAQARQAVASELGDGGERYSDLMIDPATGRYFYRVESRKNHERWFHWVDAASGGIIRKYDGRQTDHGIGVKGDTKSFAGPDGQVGTADDLTTFRNGAGDGQPGPHWVLTSRDGRQSTYDARNGVLFRLLATDPDNHWTLVTGDRASPGQPALVDAHYYARVTDSYLRDRHGLDWITGCGYPEMQSVAHYSSDYVNAFWDGSAVVYGDGDGFLAREFSGALDVVAHENTHGLTQCTSNLVYLDESGALNEAFSDMMGSSAEFFAADQGLDPAGTPDWTIGEDVYLLSPSGFRNMGDPAENLDPDHYSERQVGGDDNGGVHTNSGIPNHAYYLVVNGGSNAGEAQGHPHRGPVVTAIPLAAAERIFFLGFTGLAESATMCDARAATEAVASSLFGPNSQERLSTTDAWLAVGLTDVICNGEPPEAPTDLVAAAVASSRMNLSWTDNSSSEDGFTLERSTDGVNFAEIATLPTNSSGYVDSQLAASTSYSYRVRAFYGSRFSDYSNVAQATTGPPPAAPTNLIATAVSSGRINLGWVDNATNEAGFRVERSTDGVTFTQVTSVAANVRSYANTGLTPSTAYWYRVRAFEGPNGSDYSNVATATTPAPPAAPTNLTATTVSSNRIDLHWTDNATNETAYRVERSIDGTTFVSLVNLGRNVTSYSNTNLPAQTTYHYRVAATDGANSTYSNVASATTLPTPPSPTVLTATPVASSRIDLTWADNATYEQGYRVERSIDGVSFTQIAALGANATAYSNVLLTASTTYRYRVRAYDGLNNSAYSATVAAVTFAPPPAPTSLTATVVSPSRIDLAWTDNASYEQGYRVERSTDGVSFTQIASLAANTDSYSNTSLVAGTSYLYRVRAYDGPNNSAYSNVAGASTQAPPAAPTGLSATPASASRIDLAWTDNATNEAGYRVERSTDGVNFVQIVGLGANVTTFSNVSLAAATTYTYRVRAFEGTVNNSDYSNVAAATTLAGPAAPTGLTATAISSSRIDLRWSDNATNETGFKIERSADGVTFASLASVGANATSYSNQSLPPGTTYSYRVRAYEGLVNNSDYSNVAVATTQPPPAAPTGLAAVAVSRNRIDLAWTDNAVNEASYRVERSTDGIAFTQIAALGANVTAYSNVSLTAGTTYYYRVRVYDGPNISDYSNVASATTQPPPAAPTGLLATAVSSSRIDLSWTDNVTGETGYKVERSTNGVTFTQIAVLGANVTSYANVSLVAATTYYYRVRAYESVNNSDYSGVASATTP